MSARLRSILLPVASAVLLSPLAAYNLHLTGTVISDGQKMIGSRYMGYVKKVYVRVGDYVKREDPLYEIESAEFDILKSQADLALEQSQIVVNYWRDKLKRLEAKRKKLEAKKSVPMMDLDDLEAQADNLVTMLESARVMVKQAAIKAKQLATVYNYLKMKAPSDGIVVRRNIKVGDMVMPGMLTVMLVDMEDLEIESSLSESQIKYVHRGQAVNITIPAIDYKTKGYIKAIVPSANPMTHRISLRVSFRYNLKKHLLVPGMYARLTIRQKKKDPR